MFKKAFTLAEILITIGIIGVVAAFTIPVLVNNIANKENITHLKKSYAVLANIVQRAQVDNEAFNYWYLVDNDSEKTTFAFNRYVKPYMNIIKSCADGESGCWTQSYELNGTAVGNANGVGSNIHSFVLSDGVNIVMNIYSSQSDLDKFGIKDNKLMPFIGFYVDVNGMKAPNTFGKDIFAFVLTHKGLVPAGIDYDDEESDCNKESTGYMCAAQVMQTESISY